MKSFYTQQLAATVGIAAAWLLCLVVFDGKLERNKQPSHLSLQVSKSEPRPSVGHEPRDEASGELARHYHKDAHGSVRKVEVDFSDKTSATVEMSLFGRPARVTEKRRDGSKQVIHMHPMALQVLKIESYRPDGSLFSSTEPGKENSALRTFYKADGKTVACKQCVKSDGGLVAEIFADDGKSLKARYTLDAPPAKKPSEENQGWEPPAPVNATLEFFDADGKISRKETINREGCHECGGECGQYSETISVKQFRKDGSLEFEQEWSAYPGDNNGSLSAGCEYAADGKTKTRTFASCYEKVGSKQASQRVDKLDESGKQIHTILLDSSNTVLVEKKGDEQLTPIPGTKLDLPLLSPLQYKTLPQEFFSPELEPNRLQQILSN
ncbi:MAG: hypothetical protein K2X27_26125 [Candidatus Obscuribacterales bacterium]|nr:hypothetical protein [Candidatus Obscuribacterales bacterium]